ncbi:MAG: hemagglutinin repeat-containing protein [Burkholderiales bacterium]
MKTNPMRWKPLALAVALAFAPAARAQVTPATGGPGVASALNGVPVVNIVAPNAQGLSHNRYGQFNVESRGLILNNATQDGVSQLGGALLANPNLAGAAARLILNEVVQPNRSMLNGFIEVNGAAADVVLANPAGITCNGCGFINTPRATLTTGVPNIDGSGNLSGFSVREGDIAITGDGLNATGQTAFDILARAVSIVGRINATDLVVVGGAHDFDYASRTATAATGAGAAPVGIYVDSSLLGGMYADRIRLVATEAGVGVRLLGNVASSTGDVTLTSAGKIELQGSLTAGNNLAIQYTGGAAADAVSLAPGAVVAAANDLSVDGGAGGATFSGGTIGANHNATIVVASLDDSGAVSDLRFAGGQLTLAVDGAATFNGPNWNGSGGLSVQANSLSVGAGGAGFFAATGGNPSAAVSIHTTGDLALGDGEVSGTTANLQTDNGTLSIGTGGAVDASGAIGLGVGNGFTNGGTISAGADVTFSTLKSSGALTLQNSATGRIEAGGAVNASIAAPVTAKLKTLSGSTLIGDTLNIDVDSIDNAGKLQGTHGSTIAANGFTNRDTGLLVLTATAGSSGTLTTGTLDNAGTGLSGSTVTAGITSNGSMAINVTGGSNLINSGYLVAAQDLTVSVVSLYNDVGTSVIQAGGTLTLQGSGGSSNLSITNAGTASTILGGNLVIHGKTINNTGKIQGLSGSTLALTGSFINNPTGIVTLANLGSLTATNIQNSGKIQSFGSMTLGSSPAFTNQPGLQNTGTVVANGNLTLQLGTATSGAPILENSGSGGIQASGLLTINAAGGPINNETSDAFIRGGSMNISAPASDFDNSGSLFSSGAMTASFASITNEGTGAIFSQGNQSLTASGNIRNNAGGVILANGTLNLASTGGQFMNFMQYGSGSGGDSVGIVQSNGDLTISSAALFTNRGYIDSNGGNVTITAPEVDNISTAPSGVIPITQRQVLDSTVAVFDPPFICSSFVVFPKGGCTAGFDYMDGLNWWPQHIPHDDAHAMYWLFDPTTGVPVVYNPATGGAMPGGPYLYQNWRGKAFSGFMYDRTPVQAHIVANNGSVTINANVENIGGEIRARDNLTINGHVDQTPIALGGMTVWDVQGQDRWFCPPSVCRGPFTMDSHINDLDFSAFSLGNMVFDAAYRTQGVNDPKNGQYTIGASVTGSMVTMSAILQSSGGQRVETTAPASSSNPGGMTITGGVTNNVPPDLIPGLSQLGVSQIAPVTPVVASTGTSAGASGVQPASALIAAGVNLSLPTNPNGLFIVNPDPNAKYLVELNPLYTTLQNILFGSDYLVDKLGVDPDSVEQRLGDASYEAQLILAQLARQTGRSLIDGATDANQQLQRLFDNAAWESKDLNLTLGVALTAAQLNSLKQDMVWMVSTVVDGHTVLAPVVYLSSATRASVVGGTQIVADSLAVTGSGFINNGGTVDVTSALSIHTTGDIVNTAGTISGGNVSLVSDSGDITNNSAVARIGDATNYHDVIDRGTIVSTGTLNIAATQGNVTNSGGQIKSGGDASVSAGKDITFEAVTLESQSVTEKSSTAGIFGTQKEHTKITTTTQQAVGGDLSSGGNLTLNAGKDVTLVGSQVKTKGDLAVDAQNVNVLNATTTNTKVTEKSKSGLSVSLSSSGTLGMGYGSSNSTTTQTDVNVVASGLTSGGNTRITGRDSVTVKGSDVNSGGNLAVDTKSLSTQAAQQTTTVDRTGSSTYVGAYAGGDANSASAGWDGHHTDETSHSVDSTARTSSLSSGGNMTLGNAAGNGTISHEGTQISAGGNFSQSAATIDFTAAQNTHESSNSSTTTGGKSGINANYNAQNTYDQAKGGGVPDASAPSVTGSLAGSHDESSGSSSSTTAVAGSIHAGGNVTSTSSGKTTLEGTNVQAGGDVNLNAGSLDYRAATSTRSSSSDSSSIGGQAYLGEDATGSVVGGASGSYGTSNSSGSGTSQRAGSIVAGGNTNITTTGDATFQGTNINTGGNTSINAGGKVDYQAAVDTASSSSSSQNAGGGFDASKTGKGGDATKSGAISGNYDNSSGSSDTRIERGGSIVSGGNVTVSAGNTSDLSMTGTNIAAGGNVALSAGHNVDLKAAESTATTSSSSFSAGSSLSKETGSKPSDTNPKGDTGGSAGSVDMSAGNAGSSVSSQQGALITGRNVSVTAGQDIAMTGTVIGAKDTASLGAGGKLDMQSAQDRASSSSSSTSFSAGRSSGEGDAGHVGGGDSNSNSDAVVNHNAIVSGTTVNVTTGGDATLSGANIAGTNVTTNVGGNLKIESRSDVTNASSSQFGGYVGGANETQTDLTGNSIVSQRGELAKTGVAASYANSNASSTAVTMQSGINAGKSNTVNVTGKTDLTGARIGADAGGSVNLTTTGVTQSGVEQSSQASGSGFGFSLRAGDVQAPNGSTTAGAGTSSTLQSSVGVDSGQTPIQPTIKLADLGKVLSQAVVQTALKLSNGMKTATGQYGSPDNVPVDTVRRILGDAGVPVPAGTSDRGVRQLFTRSLKTAYASAVTQLGATNIPASQAEGILRAIVP